MISTARHATRPLAYLVECNFTRADRERAWNEWYSGPKLAAMLAKPMFESGQRFAAIDLDDTVRYLAIWWVASAEAFHTPEYTSDWGFAEYACHIADWTRNLVRLDGDDGPRSLACPTDKTLHLVRVAGLDPGADRRVRDEVNARCPGITWGTTIGLDRSVRFVGMRVLGADIPHDPPQLDGLPIRHTLFRPLTPHTPATV